MEYRMEHRCEPRITLRLPVDAWHASGFAGRFYTHDLSSSGLSLRGSNVGRLGHQLLRCRVAAPSGGCTLEGIIVHIDGARAGIALAKAPPMIWHRMLQAPSSLTRVA